MDEAEIREIERLLLEAGPAVMVPTDMLRRWLRDYRDAMAARARLDGYAARLSEVAAAGALTTDIDDEVTA